MISEVTHVKMVHIMTRIVPIRTICNMSILVEHTIVAVPRLIVAPLVTKELLVVHEEEVVVDIEVEPATHGVTSITVVDLSHSLQASVEDMAEVAVDRST